MLFPATFISSSEKIGTGLEKQAANFYFNFTRRWVVRNSCFDFFSSAKWRYFQLSGLWTTSLTYQINKYFIAQIAENTFILHRKKNQNRNIGLPFSGWNWNKNWRLVFLFFFGFFFSSPHPSFPTRKWKLMGIAFRFPNMSLKFTKNQ